MDVNRQKMMYVNQDLRFIKRTLDEGGMIVKGKVVDNDGKVVMSKSKFEQVLEVREDKSK